jgi:hypothetical protein
MKFYENLTREITLDGKSRPPLLVLADGVWKLNERVDPREAVLKPFISNHLNEALNPSHYVNLFGFRSTIRRTVKREACPQWRKLYPDRSAADFETVTEGLKSWSGEDYGHKESADFITIANTCFGE